MSGTRLGSHPRRADLKKQAHADIDDARALALFEDKITTDHISPAGAIPVDSPAARYLLEHGVDSSTSAPTGAGEATTRSW